ncbi:MAG: hypothetical protein KR126chlam2_00283 [Chlamydiae bacterium]|nr:hypothetical protein [Chlamydiota bacterium]
MRKVWIIVANSSTAKVYHAENVNTLVEINTFIHSESQMLDRDLVSDKPGRAKDHFHTMQEQTPQQVKERTVFADQIAKFLDKAILEKGIERIYLIANSPFLGFLRHSLKPNVTKLIESEIRKDLTHLRPEQVREYLPPVL